LQPLPTLRFRGSENPDQAVHAGLTGRDGKQARLSSRDEPTRVTEYEGWHTDSSFTAHVPQAAVLRPEVISPVGGDTSFTSFCAAYEGVSETMRQLLGQLKAIHAMPPGYKEAINLASYGPDTEARFDAQFPPLAHPVVIEHPHSRRRALFVNPSYTVAIEGMTANESTQLLHMIYGHITTSDYVYRHHLAPGDLIVWDGSACTGLRRITIPTTAPGPGHGRPGHANRTRTGNAIRCRASSRDLH
jgi:alpha-ketoglutarate-dependent taurine dioxygenase